MNVRGAWRTWPEAGPLLRRLLDPGAGALQPPLRSEIFGPQRFAEHGRSLGASHRAGRTGLRQSTFFPRLRDNVLMLRQAQRSIAQQAVAGRDLSPAGLWLLDNFHLIEAQLQVIREDLPRNYFRALPVLLDAPLVGLPRVYGVAWAFGAHSDGAFDEDLLLHFLRAYQGARELKLAELWALPTTLRVVLVESLRRLAERLATHKAARELAHLCCDHLDRCSVPELDALLAMLRRRDAAPVFLAQMAQRLLDRATGPAVPAAVLDWLRTALPDPAALQSQQTADQTADNLSVSNAVNSLPAIGHADWPNLVARSSALLQRMLAAPLFAAEHPRTQDQTLHGIERLARHTGCSEMAVALALLAQIQAVAGAEVGVTEVAGYWLDGPGRAALQRALGGPQGLRQRALDAWRGLRRRTALPAYLGALGLGTVALVALVLHPAWPLDAVSLGFALLLLAPASEASVVSLSQYPAPDPDAHYQGVFHADRVCLDATWPDLRTRITAWVCPEGDIEFRQVELHNLGDEPLDLELISAFEPTLADARADEAHPAFGNLFLQARALPRGLLFERRPRLATEQGLWAAHFLTDGDADGMPLRAQTDRLPWLGRNRSACAPQALLYALPAAPGGWACRATGP